MQTGELLFHLLSALGAALVGAGVALRLGQPIIVGYLIAGAAIGPFTPGFIGDADAISEIAEIGVSLLMFVVGAQLSLRKLAGSGRIVVVGVATNYSRRPRFPATRARCPLASIAGTSATCANPGAVLRCWPVSTVHNCTPFSRPVCAASDHGTALSVTERRSL